MKKWIGPVLLCLLAVVAAFAGAVVHKMAIPVNCLPLLLWAGVIALGQRRWPSLGDPVAVGLGMVYGALAGVAGAAALNGILTAALSDRYYRYPYDSVAYGVILMLSTVLLIGLAIADYFKLGLRPRWVRVVTALVTFAPCMLMAIHIMAYFEGILSRFVS